MLPPELERLFQAWEAAWPAGDERDAALAELRDHAQSVYEQSVDAGATREDAVAAVMDECGDAKQLIDELRGEPYQTRKRWTMRVATAALVCGVLVAGSIAVWWPGDTPAPLAVQPALAQQTPAAPPKAQEATAPDETERNNAAAHQQLQTYISAQFVAAPLSDVIANISEKTGVETYINGKQLAEAGIEPSAPVSISLKRVRAEMLLELALQQAGGPLVGYVVRDGIVVITTADSLDGASEVKAYLVSDLLRMHGRRLSPAGSLPDGSPAIAPPGGEGATAPAVSAPGFPGGFMGGPVFGGESGSKNADQLMSVITSTVAPVTWEERGGQGSITHYGDMLIIRQNARTHAEVEKLLKLIRDTAGKK